MQEQLFNHRLWDRAPRSVPTTESALKALEPLQVQASFESSSACDGGWIFLRALRSTAGPGVAASAGGATPHGRCRVISRLPWVSMYTCADVTFLDGWVGHVQAQ